MRQTPREGFESRFRNRSIYELLLKEKHPDFVVTRLTVALISKNANWIECAVRTGDDMYDYYHFPTEAVHSLLFLGEES